MITFDIPQLDKVAENAAQMLYSLIWLSFNLYTVELLKPRLRSVCLLTANTQTWFSRNFEIERVSMANKLSTDFLLSFSVRLDIKIIFHH